MAVSKVAYDGHTLIDLTGDTAVESDVASGKKFHKADGSIAIGTAAGGGGTVNLQNKTVNLGSSAPSSVSADSGYDGLGQVSFNVSGISAGNIKSGSSVCGVNGTYAGIIPTGTIQIANNAVGVDVSDYEFADVNVSAAFNHSVGINIDVVDGTYQLSLSISYRAPNSASVVWDTITPEEHDVDGYYNYTADLDLCTGTPMDGFYLTESSGYNLDSGYVTGKTYIEVYHSGNTRTWYFFVPSNASTYSITFAP